MKILKYMYLNEFYSAEIVIYDNCLEYNIYSCKRTIVDSNRICKTNLDKAVEEIGEFYEKLDLKKPKLSDFIITAIKIDSYAVANISQKIVVEKSDHHSNHDCYYITLNDRRCSNNLTYNEAIEKAKLLVSILK
jgi:hypothetical protein